MYEAGVRGHRRDAFRPVERRTDGVSGIQASRHVLSLGTSQWYEATAVAARLFLPVMLLLIADAACLLYAGIPSWIAGADGKPLTIGLLLLPVTFFVVQLTNRRYGAISAGAQVVSAWLIALVLLPWQHDLIAALPAIGQWEPRVVAAFATSLFMAHLASIVVFDRLRGPAWWQAPLCASWVGGAIFCLVGYPAAYAGMWDGWASAMVINLGVAALDALVLLVPYWFLRRYIEPLPGFGGY